MTFCSLFIAKEKQTHMRVICSQHILVPSLRAISKMARQESFPLYQSILFTALFDPLSGQGGLSLIGAGMFGTVGMVKQIPATVEQEGQSLVPITPLAEYVETLPPGNLLLSQEIAETVPTDNQPQVYDYLALKRASPFQIKSVFTSVRGTTSTNQARLKAWACDQYPAPPIHHWIAARSDIASVDGALLRDAIAHCTPFARGENETVEMAGVLLQIEAEALMLTATTGKTLIAQHVPLNQPAPYPFSGLFQGEALSRLEKALPREGSVSLAVAREEQRVILLLSTEQQTLFCRDMAHPALSWGTMLHHPHEAEVHVERRELARALRFFAAAVEEHQALALSVTGTTLTMKMFPDVSVKAHGEKSLQLVYPSPDLDILVNPEQLKRLVHQATGEIVQLQIGFFQRREGQKRKAKGFLRIPAASRTLAMALSEWVERPEAQPDHTDIQATAPAHNETEKMPTPQEA